MSRTFRILILITSPKMAEKTSEFFLKEEMPVHYHFNAMGTASSEMMDILGLGSAEKSIVVSVLPTPIASMMLKKLHKELKLGMVNSGIAFTIPLNGANNFLLRMLNEYGENHTTVEQRKEENTMAEAKFAAIAAIVNQGYSEQVMNAARAAGARGGTVVHCGAITDEKAAGFWGISIQGEREMVLIVATTETKVQIMQAIGKECGVNSDAKGIVLSMPVDGALGLSED